MKPSRRRYVLVLDVNAPWVRSLMAALPDVRQGEMELYAWRIFGFGYWLGQRRQRPEIARAHSGGRIVESSIIIPGWRHFGLISSRVLTGRAKRLLRQRGPPEAIIWTLPQYAGVSAQVRGRVQAYYAYDAYRYYRAWDAALIEKLENAILKSCDVGFGISRRLVRDLRERTDKPVTYSPNAVSAELIEQLRGNSRDAPSDLAVIPGTIVGCIGHLSQTGYDWHLIDRLAREFATVSFVFVGSFEGAREELRQVQPILRRTNIHWLGPKPHNQLPAYLRRFDVCLNPLALTEFNHRRSPLRLYDYLASDKPILSTGISEAYAHRGFIQIGRDDADCAALLHRILNGQQQTDVRARAEYIQQHTWEKRAQQFWNRLGNALPGH